MKNVKWTSNILFYLTPKGKKYKHNKNYNIIIRKR